MFRLDVLVSENSDIVGLDGELDYDWSLSGEDDELDDSSAWPALLLSDMAPPSSRSLEGCTVVPTSVCSLLICSWFVGNLS